MSSTIHTVVILDHPSLTTSRLNASLLRSISGAEGVQVRDLVALYPDGVIDVAAEQAALEGVDHVVLQYPTHWYTVPGLLKSWLDNVLVRGWAYGTGAAGALKGKSLRIVTSTGGAAAAYAPEGFHGWDYAEILIPMKATARRLGMTWDEPLVLHGARDLTDEDLAGAGRKYRALLEDQPDVANLDDALVSAI
jgi:putative NADPH-quinone reductase